MALRRLLVVLISLIAGCASPAPAPTGAVATEPAGRPFGAVFDAAGTFPGGFFATSAASLAVSADDGRSWSIVPTDTHAAVAVLDPAHIWIASPTPGSVWPYRGQGKQDTLLLSVNRSTDGGRTWSSVTLPDNFGGTQPELAFLDATHGFLLGAGLRFGEGSIAARTDDGGATWQKVSSLGTNLGSVFSVSDGPALWAGTQSDAGPVERPVLDVSRDGGKTWVDARLPSLVGSLSATNRVLAPPAFFGSVGIVAVEQSVGGVEAATIYRSDDGGGTWVAASPATPNVVGAFAAADADHWLGSAAGVLSKSNDGGKTWLSGPLTNRATGSIVWLGFADSLHGATLVSGGPSETPAALFITSDGGETWQPAGGG
jgi:photosystem II stability/assembly factor-like uncharacterized protein